MKSRSPDALADGGGAELDSGADMDGWFVTACKAASRTAAVNWSGFTPK
jgi:hypothetical protein